MEAVEDRYRGKPAERPQSAQILRDAIQEKIAMRCHKSYVPNTPRQPVPARPQTAPSTVFTRDVVSFPEYDAQRKNLKSVQGLRSTSSQTGVRAVRNAALDLFYVATGGAQDQLTFDEFLLVLSYIAMTLGFGGTGGDEVLRRELEAARGFGLVDSDEFVHNVKMLLDATKLPWKTRAKYLRVCASDLLDVHPLRKVVRNV